MAELHKNMHYVNKHASTEFESKIVEITPEQVIFFTQENLDKYKPFEKRGETDEHKVYSCTKDIFIKTVQ